MLNWGLVTTGRICDWFYRDMAHVEGARVLAVSSRDGERARAFADTRGIERAYDGLDALLADRDIDIVYIGSPPSHHLAQATLALRAGKAVLCEKPLTVSPAEADKLIAVQRETGGYLMEAMWTWFLPALRQARTWVEAGRIGRLVQIKADFGYPQVFDPDVYYYNPGLGGGCLLDMGVYAAALVRYFVDGLPQSVQVSARHAPSGVDDDVCAVLRYGEVTAIMGASFRAKLQNWAYIIGTDGYIAIPDFWRADEVRLYHLDTLVEHAIFHRPHQGFAFEAQAVTDDVTAGRQASSVVSLADSLAIQQIMQAIRAGF